jgi:SanA protein
LRRKSNASLYLLTRRASISNAVIQKSECHYEKMHASQNLCQWDKIAAMQLPRIKIHRRQVFWAVLSLCVVAPFAVWLVNEWITHRVAVRVFASVATVPARDVALVLGTSAHTAGGYRNPHFDHRMDAAAALYHAGKIRHLILSGDNHIKAYDEPSDMRAALLERGIPDTAMTLDYAGFRTLDSVARAKAVFLQPRITIISDDFHVARALFLAEAYGVDAIAFTSRPVPELYARKTIWREYFARVKAVLDVYVLHTQPRFYGPPIEIRLS